MNPHQESMGKSEAALRDRISLLSDASIRINESLDFDTMLQEVVNNSRALTASRFAAMTLLPQVGHLPDLIVSGLTREEHHGLRDMLEGPGFYEYFSALEEPLRVSNIDSNPRGLDMPGFLPSVPVTSLLVAPILHQGIRIGTIYLAHEGDDRGFSQEDEETLALLASQAATAIANARRHREERRARVDLEALMDTSLIGIVVIDALTGDPKSFNWEARRIVDSLRNPSQSPDQLLEDLTLRRADGMEFSLSEFPVAELLIAGEAFRAEVIVMEVPDGRSVTALLNASPILSDEGAVESVVVTLQDLAGVTELERTRFEFLALVSHELRVPLTSIKGSAATVLESATDLDPAVVRQFFRIIGAQADHMNDVVSDLLDVACIEMGTLAVCPEPTQVAALVDRAKGDFIGDGGKDNLAIDVALDLPLVMSDGRRIVQVLGNLLTNAARHSSDSSVITVTAVREDAHVAISVADEGRGILTENLPHLFRKFFRVQSEDRGGGGGLGLAICEGIVEAHGGRIRAESDGLGHGARFTFTLPTIIDAEEGTSTRISRESLRSTRRGHREPEERVRVLAVDDDPRMLEHVRDTLAQSGYAPVVTGEPDEALRLMAEERPQLVLLDLVLPETDGIELMRDILNMADVPVVFLSAYGRDELVARAFSMGAADYVVKPFSPTELLTRVAAALRRWAVIEPTEPYVLGDLTINYAERRVTVAGRPTDLIPMEYRLIAELSLDAGRAVTYQHIQDRVWGKKGTGDRRSMRTHRPSAPPQAGRRRRQPHLHLHGAPRRVTGCNEERGVGRRTARRSLNWWGFAVCWGCGRADLGVRSISPHHRILDGPEAGPLSGLQ